jgi:hypothetical protein
MFDSSASFVLRLIVSFLNSYSCQIILRQASFSKGEYATCSSGCRKLYYMTVLVKGLYHVDTKSKIESRSRDSNPLAVLYNDRRQWVYKFCGFGLVIPNSTHAELLDLGP